MSLESYPFRMIRSLPTLLLILVLSTTQMIFAQKKIAQVKKNADGTITELEHKDPQTIERRTLTPQKNGTGIVASKTIYEKARDGILRNAKIYDGKGNIIFKIKYGYHKVNGRLILEELHDAKAKRFNEQGREIPLQRLYYKYDIQGNRSKPFAITTSQKGTVEEFGSWNKHIQERMDKMKLNFDNDSPTLPSKEELEAAQKNF